jgi:hypothetical protein
MMWLASLEWHWWLLVAVGITAVLATTAVLLYQFVFKEDDPVATTGVEETPETTSVGAEEEVEEEGVDDTFQGLTREFTTPGEHELVVPAGATSAVVTLVGGGGGGGGYSASQGSGGGGGGNTGAGGGAGGQGGMPAGGGGGGGSEITTHNIDVTALDTLTVTVGAGGAAGIGDWDMLPETPGSFVPFAQAEGVDLVYPGNDGGSAFQGLNGGAGGASSVVGTGVNLTSQVGSGGQGAVPGDEVSNGGGAASLDGGGSGGHGGNAAHGGNGGHGAFPGQGGSTGTGGSGGRGGTGEASGGLGGAHGSAGTPGVGGTSTVGGDNGLSGSVQVVPNATADGTIGGGSGGASTSTTLEVITLGGAGGDTGIAYGSGGNGGGYNGTARFESGKGGDTGLSGPGNDLYYREAIVRSTAGDGGYVKIVFS